MTRSYIILGTTSITAAFARGLTSSNGRVPAIITTTAANRPNNSIDLKPVATECGSIYHETDDLNDPRCLSLIRSLEPDFIISSWPFMMKGDILHCARYGMIGSHPTKLPANRGRHPLHWMICLGITDSELTFFRIQSADGVDNGPIIYRQPFEVSPTIAKAVQAMDEAAAAAMEKLHRLLNENPTAPGKPQNEKAANVWRKRTENDIILDPRMSVEMICRTVASFAPPYPCAILRYREHSIRISLAERAPCAGSCRNAEYGRILSVDNNVITMKVADGVVALRGDVVPADLTQGSCVHPPGYYD